MSKKIGLIGNMNNNNFALLRYLLDQGLDAKLVLMKNDGVGANTHFSIANDTLNKKKWTKYIKQSNIYEDPISALNFPFSWVLFVVNLVKSFIKKKDLVLPVSKKTIINDLSEFDCLIGSGISPALLSRVDFNLTIFYPYAFGVEYLEETTFKAYLQSKNSIIRFFSNKIYKAQLKGIKQSKFVVNSDIGITKNILDTYSVKQIHYGIPLLYTEEEETTCHFSDKTQTVIKDLEKKDFVLMSHVRHLWVKPNNLSEASWHMQNKHNEWIIYAYSEFLKRHKVNSVLILFEYGEDFQTSKDLCSNLGIDDMVMWLPKSPRKDILKIMNYIDIGIGEFYSDFETTWGGALIEFLSRGKPVIHGLNISQTKFETNYGSELPPILVANSSADISDKIEYLFLNKNKIKEIGKSSKLWFDKNCGRGLATKFVNLLN
jgi:hypothetical protein